MVPVPQPDIRAAQGSRMPPRRGVIGLHRVVSQLTPSFFCRLDDDVVYWNTSRLSG